MKRSDITPELLYDLATECVSEYQIDFADLSISEDTCLKLALLNVLDKLKTVSDDDLVPILITSIVTLTVENIVLNLRLMRYENNISV